MKKEKRLITLYNNKYKQAKLNGSKKIKLFRLFCMLSERELAKKFGVAQQAISNWENLYCPSSKYVKMYVQESSKGNYKPKLTIEDIINDY